MALFDKIYKAKYSAKNYKKYCKDANSTFVYTSVYLKINICIIKFLHYTSKFRLAQCQQFRNFRHGQSRGSYNV